MQFLEGFQNSKCPSQVGGFEAETRLPQKGALCAGICAISQSIQIHPGPSNKKACVQNFADVFTKDKVQTRNGFELLFYYETSSVVNGA